MKKYTRFLVLALALSALMCMSVFAAGTIGEYTEGTNVSIDPVKDETEVTGNDKFALTYDGNAADAMYLLLVTDDAEYAKYGYPTASSIKYVNQATADENGVVKFDTVYPESITQSTIKLAGGDFTSGLQDVGSLVPEKADLDVAFIGTNNVATWTVSGDAKTLNVVNNAVACVVAYTTNNGESYTRLTAKANATTGYDFDVSAVPAGAKVIIAVKGDISGDGKLMGTEVIQVQAAQLKKIPLNALQFLVADVDGNGRFLGTEVIQIKAAQLKKLSLTW